MEKDIIISVLNVVNIFILILLILTDAISHHLLLMTFKFDKESAREQIVQSRLIDEFEYKGDKPKDLVVRQVPVSLARRFIATYHYSRTMPDSSRFCFMGYYGHNVAGVVVFGMGVGPNQYKSLIHGIKNGEYLELTRLWSPDSMPKNTESRLISESIKLLPKHIKLLVSFADPSHNHVGIIYQATNWYYCGMSNSGKLLIDSDGKVRHVKSINIYRLRHPEIKEWSSEKIMQKYGWKYTENVGKHRYVKLLGSHKEKKNMFNQIKDKIRDYPKASEVSRVDIPGFQPGGAGSIPARRINTLIDGLKNEEV